MYNSVCYHPSAICVCINSLQCMLENSCIDYNLLVFIYKNMGTQSSGLAMENALPCFYKSMKTRIQFGTVHIFENPYRNIHVAT